MGGESVLLERGLADIDECCELFAALDHYALLEDAVGGDGVFYLFGVDVLSVGAEKHVLFAAADEDVAVGIYGGEVAGVEPACFVDGFEGLLLVLVVAQHDVGAFGDDFARDVLRIGGEYLYLHAWHGLAAGAFLEDAPVFVADDGAALGHAVADGVGELDEVQEVFHFFVEGGASDDALVEVASEGIVQLVADGVVDGLPEQGDGGEEADVGLVKDGENFVSDYLLQDEGHDDDDDGLDVLECLDDDLRRGCLGEEMHVASDEELEQEVEGESVHVGHGQHGQCLVAGMEVEGFVGEVHVGPDGAVGQHDAFAPACGAAGVAEQGQVVGLLAEVLDLGWLQVGIGAHVDGERLVFHGEVADVEHARLELVGVFVAANDELGLGMVVDVLNLLDAEVGKDGYDDGAVAECCVEGDGPVGAVALAQGYLVARLEA